ncbi:MAG TPA: type II toxin-antitoxin system RelE/ParE family toxin [Clostridiales bacterium]|nr:type II toxin-antitoxin system RelE/ParE family toxin [Clostridiales bacterium]
MWKVIFFSNSSAGSEVLEYIYSLKENSRAKVFSWLNKLSELGPNLPRPYSDIITDGIHELRIKLKGDQVRILYFFCYKDYIVLTNTFIKQTDRVPEKEIRISKKIRDEFLSKYSEKEIGELYDRDLK